MRLQPRESCDGVRLTSAHLPTCRYDANMKALGRNQGMMIVSDAAGVRKQADECFEKCDACHLCSTHLHPASPAESAPTHNQGDDGSKMAKPGASRFCSSGGQGARTVTVVQLSAS